MRQLLGLKQLDAAIEPTLVVLSGFARAHPELASQFCLIEAPITGRNRLRRIFAENSWLYRKTSTYDAVHHAGGVAPRCAAPVVLTIHDLQYRTFPQYFSAAKRAYLDLVMPRSVARASAVAVPTEYVRGTVIQAYRADPARVVVVPHGVESTLGASATPESTLRKRYHLGKGRIVVFPAVTHPHKGHQFLLEVLSRYWIEDDIQLVMIGGSGRAEGEVRRSIRELGLESRALRLGRVSSDDRDGLVRMAFALVFPSQYEGFGAPVLEAMTMGVPVICSNCASLPEVVGDAALILPLELEAWAGALENVMAKRSEMVQAGLSRVQQFTARRSAEMLVKAYELALQ